MSEELEKSSSTSVQGHLREKARTSKRIAWLLDEMIRIPGTKIRFGLDPIIGLIPGGGEATATIIGATILAEAGKKGLPIRTLFKMGGNMAFNAAVGVIPGVGDLFSVWFKSNSRNYKLLNTFLESADGNQERGGWWPLLVVGGILLGIIAIHLVTVSISLFVIGYVAKQLKG